MGRRRKGDAVSGWINLDIKDRTKVADSAPIDAGKDAAVDAAPEAAAPVDAAANDARTIRPIIKIKPKTLTLVLNTGSLAEPTYWSILLFLVLFLLHLAGLVVYELRRIPQPQGAPERVAVGV